MKKHIDWKRIYITLTPELMTDATIRQLSLKMLEAQEWMNSTLKTLKEAPGLMTDATLRQLSLKMLETGELLEKFALTVKELPKPKVIIDNVIVADHDLPE